MKHIAIFVHYNRKNSLDKHVLYSLQNIREQYDELLVVSNSKMSKRHAIVLRRYCDSLLFRENKGYDFAAWRDGMKELGWNKLEEYATVTLVNDTCYFPLFTLETTISKFNNNRNIDFWGASIHKASKIGMPRSNGPVPQHLQSYFMTFKKKVVASTAFQDFWDKVEDLTDVEDVIIKYETRLTSALNKQGFRYEAIYNPKDYSDKGIINAAYQIPVVLIERSFPFLKIKAVNKANISEIVKEISHAGSTYPTNYIRVRKDLRKKLKTIIKTTLRLIK